MFEWSYKEEFYGIEPKDVITYSYQEPKLLIYLADGKQLSCKMSKNCFNRFKSLRLMEGKNA